MTAEDEWEVEEFLECFEEDSQFLEEYSDDMAIGFTETSCNACFGTGMDRDLDVDCMKCYGYGFL